MPGAAAVRVIGDALVPRKAMHAISEGRAVGGRSVATASSAATDGPAGSGDPHERLADRLAGEQRTRASGARSSPSTTDSR